MPSRGARREPIGTWIVTSGLDNRSKNAVRSSRLGLTWENVAWVGGCLQVKRAAPTVCVGRRSGCGLRLAGAAWLDDLEGEVLEFGEQRPEFLRVVEQRLPGGEFGVGEPAGDGLAADFAGPFGVGAVQP